MKAMSEEQIIQLVQNGEKDAYRRIVERYQAGVIIYCENIVHDRDSAEDIAQMAFIKAYKKIGAYRSTSAAFSTWLYAIARNQALDYMRKNKIFYPIDDAENIKAPTEMLSLPEKREIREKFAALKPPEYARVIEAYYWQGLRYEQIAEELGVPATTVGTWLSRAKNSLRKELA